MNGALAYVDYRRDGRTVTMTHAEVPAGLRGGGIGSQLVREALLLARAQGEKVVPLCSFVAAYLRRHPEFDDLLDPPGSTGL